MRRCMFQWLLQALLLSCAHQLPTTDDIAAKVRRDGAAVVSAVDGQGLKSEGKDGHASAAELVAALHDHVHREGVMENLAHGVEDFVDAAKEGLGRLGQNGDGAVRKDEVAAAAATGDGVAVSIHTDFAASDTNHDGVIDKTEAAAAAEPSGPIVHSMKKTFYPAQVSQGVRAMLKLGDADGDGKLSAAEFGALPLEKLDPLVLDLLQLVARGGDGGKKLRGTA